MQWFLMHCSCLLRKSHRCSERGSCGGMLGSCSAAPQEAQQARPRFPQRPRAPLNFTFTHNGKSPKGPSPFHTRKPAPCRFSILQGRAVVFSNFHDRKRFRFVELRAISDSRLRSVFQANPTSPPKNPGPPVTHKAKRLWNWESW